MKVRIRANNIRLRLGQEEMEQLRSGEVVEDRLSFGPDNGIVWSVQIGHTGSGPSISRVGDLIRVTIPRLGWLDDESEEGYRTSVESSPGYPVGIAVERDYACLQPRDPVEDRDSFPHPESTEEKE